MCASSKICVSALFVSDLRLTTRHESCDSDSERKGCNRLAFKMHAWKREKPVTGKPSDMKWMRSGLAADVPDPGGMR
eukprot:685581-Pleurochrysis_carterae.AAC.2